MRARLHNNEMQRTAPGKDGAPPLISVFGRQWEGEAMRERGAVSDTGNEAAGRVAERIRILESQLATLLASPVIRFDDGCYSALPEAQGVYRIFDPTRPHDTIRAGRTKSAAGGLRQRVYQNHLMGTQAGNLRARLVSDRVCADSEAAKQFIRERLAVQVLAVENEDDRTYLEYFILGVLRPRYCD